LRYFKFHQLLRSVPGFPSELKIADGFQRRGAVVYRWVYSVRIFPARIFSGGFQGILLDFVRWTITVEILGVRWVIGRPVGDGMPDVPNAFDHHEGSAEGDDQEERSEAACAGTEEQC